MVSLFRTKYSNISVCIAIDESEGKRTEKGMGKHELGIFPLYYFPFIFYYYFVYFFRASQIWRAKKHFPCDSQFFTPALVKDPSFASCHQHELLPVVSSLFLSKLYCREAFAQSFHVVSLSTYHRISCTLR